MHIACYKNLLEATKAMAKTEGANVNIQDDVRQLHAAIITQLQHLMCFL